ncbi:M20/M25/M40 family metallo-hydrolase [Cochleicola gelatinilyticus]|uniref:M20/M25/M40 family metallo-hydrolase n=1 Tax=Cochleicola gelatinilyticus TaxID=1763537 RepID=UPI000839463F|nr:M20/M25/M40 family metallo-hydrolase [Cochleicola gelatinilyticus]
MRKLSGVLSLLIILLLLYLSFFTLMPQKGKDAKTPLTEFSSERALIPLKEISKAPHYLGSKEHERVRNYLVAQLEALGLETEIQEGFVLNTSSKSLDKPKNIVARIKGENPTKSLLLLSHYDSALVPSNGASDAGSGIVTILESLRAYQASGKTPKNDVIILFSDGEEIGLDGAKLFVNEHPWAKNIGLILNFEARGSGGPSNMILETNHGNSNLIKGFIAANPKFPVSSSLMYSVYKLLPNSTDSTVFRERGDIDSFFFAFIDDHYDYHTANDTFENLDRNTLQHQGSYLLPLLHYFADADLSQLRSETDNVYVNLPFLKLISYPFSWILPMLLLCAALFIVLLFFGISKGKLKGRTIAKGFGTFLLSLVLCGGIGYFGWILLLKLYPQYNEIQHGFTYNGHAYIAFFVLLSLAILFKLYKRYSKKDFVAGLYVAPLTFWLLVNIVVVIYLKGAAFFVIPLFFGLISLFLLIHQERPSLLLLAFLAAPALFILGPLIQFFPVGLGLKMLVISCVFTVLLFGLLLPVFGFYVWKNISSLICFILAIVFFITAHIRSDFSEKRQKPNSLLFYKDADTNQSYWLTYDSFIDDWTKGYLGEDPETASNKNLITSYSKYSRGYSFIAEAPNKNIPKPAIEKTLDTIYSGNRDVTFTIYPNRNVNQIELYAATPHAITNISFNGKNLPLRDRTNSIFASKDKNNLIRHYVSDGDSLRVTYSSTSEIPIKFTLQEYSFDLMSHPQFSINPRPKTMMPKPFVVTDAVVLKHEFTPTELPLSNAIHDTLVKNNYE